MINYDPSRRLVIFSVDNEIMSNGIFLNYYVPGFMLKVKLMVKIVISMHSLICLTMCHYTGSKMPKIHTAMFHPP